jgi:hypothetical protein
MDDVNGTGSEFAYLKTFADFWANPGSTLHNKYCVVDAYKPLSEPTVLTGSHNWSAAAETSNDENTLIITDLKIANQYMQEFKKRYNEAGGTGTFVVPTDVRDGSVKDYSISLFQNYPNPFNPVTTIRFVVGKSENIRLEVFDALGQSVGVLFDSYATPAIYAVDFNSNNLHRTLTSGIYYFRLSAGSTTITKKMALTK